MRKSKLQVSDVVSYGGNRTGVVVDHRKGASRPYRVVETDSDGDRPRGSATWMKASDLQATGEQRIPPVEIYRGNLESGFESDCNCRIHLSPAIKQTGVYGFMDRIKAIAEAASWECEELPPDRMRLTPQGPSPTVQESVKQSIQRAVKIEDVEVQIHSSSSDIWITLKNGLPEPFGQTEPELDGLEKAVESLGWTVRARLGEQYWIVKGRNPVPVDQVLEHLGLSVVREASEGFWIVEE